MFKKKTKSNNHLQSSTHDLKNTLKWPLKAICSGLNLLNKRQKL